MSSHRLSKVIKGFNLASYYSGINFAFAEVVRAGCKRLALSSPYTPDEAAMMMEPTILAVEEYGVTLYVEKDLLVSKLFPADIAVGYTIMMIAYDQSVLDEYLELKRLKEESNQKGNPEELETSIAKRFGKLLSYDDAKIEELLAKHG